MTAKELTQRAKELEIPSLEHLGELLTEVGEEHLKAAVKFVLFARTALPQLADALCETLNALRYIRDNQPCHYSDLEAFATDIINEATQALARADEIAKGVE